MATKKKVRPQRDMTVPAMIARNGGGKHKDHRKDKNKNGCRGKHDQDSI